MATRILFVAKSVSIKLSVFLKEVCFPTFLASIVAFIPAIAFHKLIPDTLLGFLLSCVISIICVLLAIYFIGLNGCERYFILNYCYKFFRKNCNHE